MVRMSTFARHVASKANQKEVEDEALKLKISEERMDAYFKGWEDGQSMLMEAAMEEEEGHESDEEKQWKRRKTIHKWWWRGYCYAKMKYASWDPSAVLSDPVAGGLEEEWKRCFDDYDRMPGASFRAWSEWEEGVREEDGGGGPAAAGRSAPGKSGAPAKEGGGEEAKEEEEQKDKEEHGKKKEKAVK